MAAHDSSTGPIRTVRASEFKAKCLQLMDQVAESGEEIVITKFGTPVAKLAPLRERPRAPWFGRDKGLIVIHGDLDMDTGEEWEAESDPERVSDPC